MPMRRMPSAIAPEVTSVADVAARDQLADLAADLAQHVGAHVPRVVRNESGAHLYDGERHMVISCLSPGYSSNATAPISTSSPGSNPSPPAA